MTASPRDSRDRAGRRAGQPRTVADAGWVAAVRLVALGVLAGLVVLGLTEPRLTGRLTWTVAIAALPLFIVVIGYHRWRRVCPLAFVAQVPIALGWSGRRRAGRWLQAHAYHVIFGAFVVSLWLRLVATNGDGRAIAAFLVGVGLAAIGVGLVYTGKTWCNYVCPVSFVEKLYTEPRGLRETPNSQCATCTACRPACPDINEENSYWKEILQPAKRHVFYAFPGVVLAFYGYYYLQSGTWAYYFDGAWTAEPGVARTAFVAGRSAATAGLFFWPAVPRAVAAAATLVAGGALGLAAFSAIERYLGPALQARGLVGDDAGVRHVMFSLAGFAAFTSFYSFAGAPTLRLVPGLTGSFQIAVVAVATLALARRIGRRQQAFAEETLARRIIAKWPWEDRPPRDLREAFLVHTIRSQSTEAARAELLALYKSAVRDATASGVISRAEVQRLESLRTQLRISEADHERVMAALAEEEDAEAAAAWARSPEKQLQLDTYAEALGLQLEHRQATDGVLDDALIRELRAQYGVSAEEHVAVVDRLTRDREGVAAHIANAPAAIERASLTCDRLAAERSPIARFLDGLLTRRRSRAVDGLLRTLAGDDSRAAAWRDALQSRDAGQRATALDELGALLSPAVATRLAEGRGQARATMEACDSLASALRVHLDSPDPYVRAAVCFYLSSREELTEADRARLADDDHVIVREVLDAVAATRSDAAPPPPTVIEKMIGLRSVSMLEDLDPEELARLARAGSERWFREGEALCRQGDAGDEVFVILDGEVTITQTAGDAERVLGVEGPGSCIGELAVLDPAPRAATVVASTVAVRALELSGQHFRAAVDASPGAARGIMQALVRRLRRSAVTSR